MLAFAERPLPEEAVEQVGSHTSGRCAHEQRSVASLCVCGVQGRDSIQERLVVPDESGAYTLDLRPSPAWSWRVSAREGSLLTPADRVVSTGGILIGRDAP